MKSEQNGSRRLDPNGWMRKQFPEVFGSSYEDCFLIRKGGTAVFLSAFKAAECLGPVGSPKAPVRFSLESGTYYAYSPQHGIYQGVERAEVENKVYELLEECAKGVKRKHIRTVRSVQKPSEASAVAGALRGLSSFADPNRHRDLRYVHVQNGVLDLDTLDLLPFTPDLPSAWKLPVPWTAQPPRPHQFWGMMKRLFPDPDDRALAVEVLSTAFLGNPFQRFVLISGAAGTGKSTLVSLLSKLLGPGASGTLELAQARHRFASFSWMGRLLLYESELTQESLDHGLPALKTISGHDPMTAEKKFHSTLIPFTPRALPVLATNERVRFNCPTSQRAVARRLVAFDVPEPSASLAQVPHFAAKLIETEGPGILRVFLTEAHRLRQQGRLRPLTDNQMARNARYLGMSDVLWAWAKGHVAREEGASVLRDEAIHSAERWLAQHKFPAPTSATGWSRRLKPIFETLGGKWTKSLGEEGNLKGWRQVKLL